MNSLFIFCCVLRPIDAVKGMCFDVNGTINVASQKYRAWSDCTDVQAGQALYWWQRLQQDKG